MSTSSSPSLHPTRRQLDELDALMERMLELPVDSTAEGTNEAATDSQAPSDSSNDAFAAFMAPGFASYTTENETLQTGSPDAFNFSSAIENPAPSASERGASPFAFQPTALPSTTVGTHPGASLIRSTDESNDNAPPPAWLFPVVGINRVYDGVMGSLGRPGKFFMSTGRAWLGWIGLVMLAAALAWGILDWITWAG